MPLTAVQRRVLAIIAANRSPESYVAGGAALNHERSRISDDLDIFHPDERVVYEQAAKDVALLAERGFAVRPVLHQFGLAEYEVGDDQGETLVQWMEDTDLRFFPVLSDEVFGWRLADADLAVNKVIAAATRRQVRDAIDVAGLDAGFLAFGALVWAAVAKTPLGPEAIVDNVIRNAATHSREEYASARSVQPVDGARVLERLIAAGELARGLFRTLPTESYGCLFIDDQGQPTLPTAASLPGLRVHPVTHRGVWPTFPDQHQARIEQMVRAEGFEPPTTAV